MLANYHFRPQAVHLVVEPKFNKLRLCFIAFCMFGIALAYNAFFDGILMRSNIIQEQALAGQRSFANFIDKNSLEVYEARMTLAVLEEKAFKDMKFFVNKDEWVSNYWQDTWVYQQEYIKDPEGNILYDEDGNSRFTTRWIDQDQLGDPNGDPQASELYFTQPQDEVLTEYTTTLFEREELERTDPIEFSNQRYDEWLKMRQGSLWNTIWYDTGACLDGPHIGDINKVAVSPSTTRFNQTEETKEWFCLKADCDGNPDNGEDTTDEFVYTEVDGWFFPYNGNVIQAPYMHDYAQEKPRLTRFVGTDVYDRQIYDSDYGFATYRSNRWDTSIKVDGKVGWGDEDLYRDYLRAWIDMVDDCDIDCQQRGSALTPAAFLLAVCYGLFALSGLCMVFGVINLRCRKWSIYCTFFSCLVLIASLIISATFLFSTYNSVCIRSMTKTVGEGSHWTLHDDLHMTRVLWFSSWVTGSVLCIFGSFCQAYQAPEKKKKRNKVLDSSQQQAVLDSHKYKRQED